jgi:hypothetical protein
MMLTAVILYGLTRFERMNPLPAGFIGSIGFGAYALMLFLGEFLSGNRKDILYDYFGLGLNQIGAVLGLIFAIV